MKETNQINQLVDHFFRHESGKMISVLTKLFGTQNIDLAEDVVQDSLMKAILQWQYNGIPENPNAWLYTVAKNKALTILNRKKYKREYTSSVLNQNENKEELELSSLFSENEIQDDQLKMIFTCCHPSISSDSQISLALKTLCGFSIPEIAKAFLTTEENINKRLVRARQKIRDDKIPFEIPIESELQKRLQSVLETIYLLFNEGYSASKGNQIIRYELCEEAIRLASIIQNDSNIKQKDTLYAFISLMQINASRFKARQDSDGNLLTLAEQNRTLWNSEMLQSGLQYLELSMKHDELSIYHILAAISANYSVAPDYESTDWNTILSLYDSLIVLDKSPLVLLNRAIVLSKVRGADEALSILDGLADHPTLKSYHLFYSAQAELLAETNQFQKAIFAFEKAIQFASMQSEKDFIKKKMVFYKNKIN